jgi:hypothetical protein
VVREFLCRAGGCPPCLPFSPPHPCTLRYPLSLVNCFWTFTCKCSLITRLKIFCMSPQWLRCTVHWSSPGVFPSQHCYLWTSACSWSSSHSTDCLPSSLSHSTHGSRIQKMTPAEGDPVCPSGWSPLQTPLAWPCAFIRSTGLFSPHSGPPLGLVLKSERSSPHSPAGRRERPGLLPLRLLLLECLGEQLLQEAWALPKLLSSVHRPFPGQPLLWGRLQNFSIEGTGCGKRGGSWPGKKLL